MSTKLPSRERLKPNTDWAKLPLFDRKGWTRVRFGDVVKQLKEQVDPSVDGIERYVAGEHMETENVHIRKWGTVGDGYLGPAFIRGFRKGQVLYGSRRTYLKKVAVAEWDGVTANTTFVLEAVEGKLLQELLPWLMLSERFTKHSVQESKGSTNPYINFPDIAKFEFDLPPLDQQRRIAEILWAVDEAARARAALHSSLDTLRRSLLVEEFESPQTVSKLASVLDYASDGPFGSKLKTEHYAPNGPRVIRLQNIGDGVFDVSDEACIAPEYFGELKRYEVRGGDVIVAGLGDETHPVGRAVLVPHSLGKAVNKADCFCLRTKADRMKNAYLVSFLNSIPGNKQVRARAQGTTRLRVNVGNLKTVDVPVTSLDHQQRFVERLAELDAATAAAGSSVEADHAVRTSVLNQLF
jgi:type I restriction enzyme S subunit